MLHMWPLAGNEYPSGRLCQLATSLPVIIPHHSRSFHTETSFSERIQSSKFKMCSQYSIKIVMYIVTHTDRLPSSASKKTLLEKTWDSAWAPTFYKGLEVFMMACQGWQGMIWGLTLEVCRDVSKMAAGKWVSAFESHWNGGWGRCYSRFKNFGLNKSINSLIIALPKLQYIKIWHF